MSEKAPTSLVPLAEFQRITGLSDGAIVWLLKHNKIPLSYSPASGISVDAAHADTRTMVAAMVEAHDELLTENAPVLEARISAVLRNHLETVLTAAQARLRGAPPKTP